MALALLAGCSSGDQQSQGDPETSKYTQTWTKAYADTTCTDWQATMTSAQTWAASADMLSAARDNIDHGTGVAPDALITRFQGDITEACSADVDGLKLADVAIGVYQIGHDEYQP